MRWNKPCVFMTHLRKNDKKATKGRCSGCTWAKMPRSLCKSPWSRRLQISVPWCPASVRTSVCAWLWRSPFWVWPWSGSGALPAPASSAAATPRLWAQWWSAPPGTQPPQPPPISPCCWGSSVTRTCAPVHKWWCRPDPRPGWRCSPWSLGTGLAPLPLAGSYRKHRWCRNRGQCLSAPGGECGWRWQGRR